MNDILKHIEELTTMENVKDLTFSEAIYRLANINQLCKNCTDGNTDQNPVKISFKDFCNAHKPSTDNKKLEDLLDRNGNHAMNLKFEIRKRWPNKSYANTIVTLLANNYINNMDDFMKVFDDYRNLLAMIYPESQPRENIAHMNKVFPANKLSNDDKHKFQQLYYTANEFNNKMQHIILIDFINEPAGDPNARYYNSLARYGICNINQLYFYLKNHKLNDLKEIKGIGHISNYIRWMYDTIHKND